MDKKQSLTLWLAKANKDIDLRQLLDSRNFFYNSFTYTTYLKLFDVNVATLMGCILALYHVTIFCSKSHSLDKTWSGVRIEVHIPVDQNALRFQVTV